MCSVPSPSLLLLRGGVTLPLAAGILMLAASPAAAVPTFTQACFDTNLSHAIAVADFNEDGNLDVTNNPGQQLGIAFSFDAIVNVYLGDGTGAFGSATQFSTAGAYLDIFATDVDHDGNLDLVAGGNPQSVLRGNGDGTFQSAETYPSTSFSLAVGDLNQDGFTDLITPDDRKGVIVRLNQGNGTFGAGTRFNVGDPVRALTTSDVNGDGSLDVVTLSQSYVVVAVLLGKGNGKLGHSMKTNLPGSPGLDLGPADLNGDGKVDLVVPLTGGGGLLVVLGNGDGTFGAPTSYPMAGSTSRVAVGDVDGDGDTDIVAGNFAANYPNPGGNVSILYGDGTGAFTIGSVIPVPVGNGVEVADLDADSDLDIVVDSCVLLQDGTVAAARAVPAHREPAGDPNAGMNVTAAFSPNPLRGDGALGFSLPKDGMVSIHLYDIRGRRVHTLMEATRLAAGPHAVGLDRRAAGLGAGIYLYRIEAEGSRKSGRIVVLDQ